MKPAWLIGRKLIIQRSQTNLKSGHIGCGPSKSYQIQRSGGLETHSPSPIAPPSPSKPFNDFNAPFSYSKHNTDSTRNGRVYSPGRLVLLARQWMIRSPKCKTADSRSRRFQASGHWLREATSPVIETQTPIFPWFQRTLKKCQSIMATHQNA